MKLIFKDSSNSCSQLQQQIQYLKSVQHLGVASSSAQCIMGGQLVLNSLNGVRQVSQLF